MKINNIVMAVCGAASIMLSANVLYKWKQVSEKIKQISLFLNTLQLLILVFWIILP